MLQYITCTILINTMLICLQRQRIRELILKQQQQKSAMRQDKGVQDHPLTMPPGTPQNWSQGATGQQSEIFNRPPPPYPGPGAVRPPQRFHGPFPGDHQGHFPEGQFPRPQFPVDADSSIRQLGQRWVNLYTSKHLYKMYGLMLFKNTSNIMFFCWF